MEKKIVLTFCRPYVFVLGEDRQTDFLMKKTLD